MGKMKRFDTDRRKTMKWMAYVGLQLGY